MEQNNSKINLSQFKARIAQLGFTQLRLARELRIASSTLSAYIHSTRIPKPHVVAALSNLLECPEAFLVLGPSGELRDIQPKEGVNL